jgi:hypothetical protein
MTSAVAFRGKGDPGGRHGSVLREAIAAVPGAGTTVTAHVGDPAGVAAQPAAAEL